MSLPDPLAGVRQARVTWRPGRVPHARALLQAEIHHTPLHDREIDAVIGWGRKTSGVQAMALAERLGSRWVLLEDAFLRSIDLGFREGGYGIVVDDRGVYYDATMPSRLESLVALPLTEPRRARASALQAQWCAGRVSKYNLARECSPPLAPGFVLVVDQTAGDSSIATGLADARSFHTMLEAALDEHPGRRIVLKVHPDVISGRKRGHFDHLSPGQASRVELLATDAHPPGLIEPAHAVYTVTSQMGFEAMLWKRPVRVFGMPFYAGWGLSTDALPAPARRSTAAFEALVHAALIDYARYVDPETMQPCDVETLLDWMALQHRQRGRFPQALTAVGFKGWKRPVARAYFSGSALSFVREGDAAPQATALAVWGRRPLPPGATAETVVHVEDGFLRSVGLGADMIRPMSWVMDGRGMYFDATAPSDLEHLLAHHEFDDALKLRAARLRERVISAGLTKYNVGQGAWHRPEGHARVALVPGQVEQDASIRHGAIGAVRSNADLLRAARAAAPDAYLVYKPHPDVVAGLRAQGEGEAGAGALCDEMVVDVPMHRLLEAVDEVHTMTSLTGFEALLRGLRVVCHGCPFYAGWGLTDDRVAAPRRGRARSLDELVAATLILYPTYLSRRSGQFTTPERAIDELLAWRDDEGSRVRRWPRWLRPIVSRWLGWRGR